VLLMILPPGGFLALGFLVAARQRMLARARARSQGAGAAMTAST
jgi:electron transport complex protein RnfE